MRFLKNRIFLLIISSVFLLCTNVFALEYYNNTATQVGPDTVDETAFTLDYIYEAGLFAEDGDGRYDASPQTNPPYWYGATGDNLLSYKYYATTVAGFYDGNDSGELKPDAPNTGIDGEGFMNGESNDDGVSLSGDAFFTTDYDQYQNLYGDDDTVDDPGWIYLGKAEVGDEQDDGSYADESYEYENLGPVPDKDANMVTINIGQLLTLNFDFNENTWELATDPMKKDAVVTLLGGASFDHLAFIMKAGNDTNLVNGVNEGGGFAIFDFNFNLIFREYEKANFDADIVNFNTAYVLGGTFNGDNFGRGISHISVVAKDPIFSTVPEPASMVLFGLGLLAIARVGRRKSA